MRQASHFEAGSDANGWMDGWMDRWMAGWIRQKEWEAFQALGSYDAWFGRGLSSHTQLFLVSWLPWPRTG
jgi:hypothetical protein